MTAERKFIMAKQEQGRHRSRDDEKVPEEPSDSKTALRFEKAALWLEGHNWARRSMSLFALFGVVTVAGFAGAEGYRVYDEHQSNAFREATTPRALGSLLTCSFQERQDAAGSVLVIRTDTDAKRFSEINTKYDSLWGKVNRQVSSPVGQPTRLALAGANGETVVDVPESATTYGNATFPDRQTTITPPSGLGAITEVTILNGFEADYWRGGTTRTGYTSVLVGSVACNPK